MKDNTRKIPDFDQLPPLDPPPALWSSIRSELDQRRQARRLRRTGWVASAVAAVAVVAVVVSLVVQPQWLTDPASTAPTLANSDETALVQARQLSAVLEARLRQQHYGAVSAVSVESLVWLENELGWLDIRLASTPDNLDLWQRRTELLAEMNRLYGRNSWQTQIQQTSF